MEPNGLGRGRAGVEAKLGVVDDGAAVSARGFDELYRTEWPGAVRLAHLLTGSAAAAEDLAQDAFVRVHRSWTGIERPGAFLHVTLVNVCRSWHRSRGREQARLLRVAPRAAATSSARARSVGTDNADPADLADPVEHLALLDALDRLPYRQKAVLVLRYYDGLPEAEIATALGCRPGTVKSLASRGLERLRQVIDR